MDLFWQFEGEKSQHPYLPWLLLQQKQDSSPFLTHAKWKISEDLENLRADGLAAEIYGTP